MLTMAVSLPSWRCSVARLEAVVGLNRKAALGDSFRPPKTATWHKLALPGVVQCQLSKDPGNGNAMSAIPKHTPSSIGGERRDSGHWEPDEEHEREKERKREGEDPYRIVGGKKVYVDELDILDVLDGYGVLTPFDPSNYNAASFLWKKIEAIPEERRHRLLDILLPRHISRLWQVAGDRPSDWPFGESSYEMLTPGTHETTEMEAQFWSGRVIGLPGPIQWLGRFQKVFFVGEDGGLYGRVITNVPILCQLANAIAPLYFRVHCTTELRTLATGERCDVTFRYAETAVRLHRLTELPHNFPSPTEPLWPFSEGMKDYVRFVGPGVVVGQSWMDGRSSKSTPTQFLGEFVLIK